MITGPRPSVPGGAPTRTLSLAALLAAFVPSAPSALPPHGPAPQPVYLQGRKPEGAASQLGWPMLVQHGDVVVVSRPDAKCGPPHDVVDVAR